ncbi:PhoX family phosphatase [uncultured Methylibium sp.]|uniref:PhoX family protein n=1 Tax=uncultured Methylibium sp. TaxID=381093 RepID=UPI0025D88E39|nr:PhoX family phosphatase [uncultured Methylibium sp.]
MPKDFASMEDSNPSTAPDLHALSDPARRVVVGGGLAAALRRVLAPLAGLASAGAVAARRRPLLGFDSVPTSVADTVVVPPGYVAEVLIAWGDPIGAAAGQPAFASDASQGADEQALQSGMHHDGMHFFPVSATRGLLVTNHEYVDDGLLHADGLANWSADKVRKSQAAHGVSVIEIVRRRGGRWHVLRPSRHARRITATTPMRIAGPAAGHALMQTALDPGGTQVLGTFNNCAHGVTPWGTYLACEENFVDYFRAPEPLDAHQRRWGLRASSGGWYRWHEHDERFDARRHPNEFNRHGWVVEIDPFDPDSTPVKRTALGRAAHEGAWVAQAPDGRVAVYMGEDARFEYLYKFVSRDAVRPGGYAANRTLLDHGTLHVARFDADGRGEWIPLVAGQGGLDAEAGFGSQGELLVKTRQAADRVGATRLDRPEWTAGDPRTGEVYCSLTNNRARGQAGQPPVDAANPRAGNSMGQILRWKEDGGFAGTRFTWEHFVLAGDPANERPEARGNVRGDAFGSPDGLYVDPRGVLWIQTDASSTALGRGDYARLGNNMMLAADPVSGEVRRFLTGPVGSEIAGAVMTPDLRTLFVNIQHPGESPGDRSDPGAPTRHSSWPQEHGAGGRPRSATLVVRRRDGGVIGS